MDNSCKMCLLRECGDADTYKSVAEHIEKIKASQRTGEAEYQRRLGICKECEHLLSGVCMQCGCYPELRGAFAKMRCPDVNGGRW